MLRDVSAEASHHPIEMESDRQQNFTFGAVILPP
jgi:hypothetical protein